MKKNYEMMIDVETLDVEDTAVVFEVAVVFFKGKKRHKYRWVLDVDQQLRMGRTLSADTLLFHMNSPKGLKDCLRTICKTNLWGFTQRFHKLFKFYNPKECWSKGSFDFPLVAQLFNDEVPWEFWQLRDLRTLMKECGVDSGKIAHTAMADCMDQIRQLEKCRKVIK